MAKLWLAFGVFVTSTQAILRPTLWHHQQQLDGSDPDSRSDTRRQSNQLLDLFQAHSLSVPVDHFHDTSKYEPHSNETFPLRYWFDASHYRPGGPVFLLAAGETDGSDRLPFLQKGIIHQLAKENHGVAVVLEHRYYGESFPVPNLSVRNLRFLTTEQALADARYFAQNVIFPGLERYDLRAKSTAWIIYGGSYAGAFAAFSRVLYPDVFWGAISSSGVTKAIVDYWEYFEPVRKYGPTECIAITQDLVELVDNNLLRKGAPALRKKMKETLGLQGIDHDTDFVATLAGFGVWGWQDRNWDPEVTSTSFEEYCANITSDMVLFPSTIPLRPAVEELIQAAMVPTKSEALTRQMLNYAGWINHTIIPSCHSGNQKECFDTYNDTAYRNENLKAYIWRSWQWQVCTEWGYFYTSMAPPEIRTLQSRLIDMEYSSKICKQAFNITNPPDVDLINKFGGFDIEYDRLAIIDGQADPWRYATPHAPVARQRQSTSSKPFIQMDGAIHHWDENGRFANETTPELPPSPVREGQEGIRRAVAAWVEAYNMQRPRELVVQ